MPFVTPEESGRVEVFVRIRPLHEDEKQAKEPLAVSCSSTDIKELNVLENKVEKKYIYDQILPPSSDNNEVFCTVMKPLVYSALNGFNSILMCYGQTGTGKTHTLMSWDGMTARTVYKCFELISLDRQHKYQVSCSYLQIYQEKVYDLLNATVTRDLMLREHPKTGVYVENLSHYVVHSATDVLSLLKQGARRLAVGETKMNRHSSRSHAICILTVQKERSSVNQQSDKDNISFRSVTPEGCPVEDESLNMTASSISGLSFETEDIEEELSHLIAVDESVSQVSGKLYICDLAGSERVKRTFAQGERLQEAQRINLSLLELGNVIQALAEGNRAHVPFRNSTLTRLLQEGLSGNCRTRLVVCVSPALKDVNETKCSLNFGSRAMNIKVKAQMNFEVDYKKLVDMLNHRVDQLEAELKQQRLMAGGLQASVTAHSPSSIIPSPSMGSLVQSGPCTAEIEQLLLQELLTLSLVQKLRGATSTAACFGILGSSYGQMVIERGIASLCQLMMLVGMESLMTAQLILQRDARACPALAEIMEKGGKVEPRSLSTLVTSLLTLKSFLEREAVGVLQKLLCDRRSDCQLSQTIKDVISKLDKTSTPVIPACDKPSEVQEWLLVRGGLFLLLTDKALLCCLVILSEGPAGTSTPITASSRSSTRTSYSMAKLVSVSPSETQLLHDSDKNLEDYLDELERLARDSKYRKEVVEAENRTLTERMKGLELDQLHSKQEKDDIQKRCLDLEKRCFQLEQELKVAENNHAKKERVIMDMKNEKVSIDNLLKALRDELHQLEKDNTFYEKQVQLMREELEGLKDRNLVLETEYSCCQEENLVMENELQLLEREKCVAEQELLRQQEEVVSLEQALLASKKSSDSLRYEVEVLRSREEKFQAALVKERERFVKDLASLKQEMSGLRLEKRQLQRDITTLKSDRTNLERAFNGMKYQKDHTQQDVSHLRAEEKRLQKEMAAVKLERTRAEKELQAVKLDNAKLKSELLAVERLRTDVRQLKRVEESVLSVHEAERSRNFDEMTSLKAKVSSLEAHLSGIEEERKVLIQHILKFFPGTTKDHADVGIPGTGRDELFSSVTKVVGLLHDLKRTPCQFCGQCQPDSANSCSDSGFLSCSPIVGEHVGDPVAASQPHSPHKNAGCNREPQPDLHSFDASSDVSNLKTELALIHEAYSSTQSSTTLLTIENKALRRAVSCLKEDCRSLKVSLQLISNELVENITSTDATVLSARVSLLKAFEDKHATQLQLDECRRSEEVLVTQLNFLKDKFSHLEKGVCEIFSSTSSFNTPVADRQAVYQACASMYVAMDEMRRLMVTVATRVNKFRRGVEFLSEQWVGEKQTLAENLIRDVDGIYSMVSAITTRIDSTEVRLKSVLSTLPGKPGPWTAETPQDIVEINSIQASLASTEQEILELEKQNSTICAEGDLLQMQNCLLVAELHSALGENESLIRSLAELETQWAKLQAETANDITSTAIISSSLAQQSATCEGRTVYRGALPSNGVARLQAADVPSTTRPGCEVDQQLADLQSAYEVLKQEKLDLEIKLRCFETTHRNTNADSSAHRTSLPTSHPCSKQTTVDVTQDHRKTPISKKDQLRVPLESSTSFSTVSSDIHQVIDDVQQLIERDGQFSSRTVEQVDVMRNMMGHCLLALSRKDLDPGSAAASLACRTSHVLSRELIVLLNRIMCSREQILSSVAQRLDLQHFVRDHLHEIDHCQTYIDELSRIIKASNVAHPIPESLDRSVSDLASKVDEQVNVLRGITCRYQALSSVLSSPSVVADSSGSMPPRPWPSFPMPVPTGERESALSSVLQHCQRLVADNADLLSRLKGVNMEKESLAKEFLSSQLEGVFAAAAVSCPSRQSQTEEGQSAPPAASVINTPSCFTPSVSSIPVEEREQLIKERLVLKNRLETLETDKRHLLEDYSRMNQCLSSYMRYNKELERRVETRVESLKKDLSGFGSKLALYESEEARSLGAPLFHQLCPSCQGRVKGSLAGLGLVGREGTSGSSLEAAGISMARTLLFHDIIEEKKVVEKRIESALLNNRPPNGSSNTLRKSSDGKRTHRLSSGQTLPLEDNLHSLTLSSRREPPLVENRRTSTALLPKPTPLPHSTAPLCSVDDVGGKSTSSRSKMAGFLRKFTPSRKRSKPTPCDEPEPSLGIGRSQTNRRKLSF